MNVSHYAKAIIAFLVPAAGIIIGAVLTSSAGGESITSGEWITAICTAIISGGGTYAITDGSKAAQITKDGQIVATAGTPGIPAGTVVDISPVDTEKV